MTPLYPPTRPLPISQVLDLAFRMFKVSFVRCLAFGPICMIVGQLPNIYWLTMGMPRETFGGNAPVWWALYVVGFLGSLLLSAALIFHQRDIVSGVPTRAFAQVATALRRLPSLLGLLLSTLVIIGVPVGAAVFAASRNPALLQGAAGLAAGVLLLLALSYMALVMAIIWSSALVDGLSPMAAVRNGFRLIQGHWWRVFAVYTVAGIVTLVVYFVIGAVAVPLAGAMDVATLTAVTEMLVVGASALVLPYFGATSLALYGDLKARKEGTDLEQRIVAAARP